MDNDAILISVAALFATSEALALIPQIKANSIFQLVYFVLRRMAGRGND